MAEVNQDRRKMTENPVNDREELLAPEDEDVVEAVEEEAASVPDPADEEVSE